MPIYDYHCTSCGYKKEVMRKISEPNLTLCPECGKETFTKQLSAPSFQLSGSGWYATDFKNSGAKKTEAKPQTDSHENNAENSSAEKITDKKPESATATTVAPASSNVPAANATQAR